MTGITGHCLCGAVTVASDVTPRKISACHCGMCTRWSGSVQMGLEVPEESVTIEGPIRTYRSSGFAERAWCGVCGSAVYFRNVAGKDSGFFEFAPGLFENAAGARLVRVVYADCAPGGYRIEGDGVERVSKADYEATHDHVPEDAT